MHMCNAYMCNNIMCTCNVYAYNNVMRATVFSYFNFFRVYNNTCRQSRMLAKEAISKMCANEAVDNRECRQTGSPPLIYFNVYILKNLEIYEILKYTQSKIAVHLKFGKKSPNFK